MLAVHLDGLLFFLLVGIALFFRMLSKKAGAGTEEDQAPPTGMQPPSLPPQSAADTDEVRIRKFLEALGQPTSSAPPPPVKPRATPAPVPEFQRQQMEEAARTARRRNLMSPLPPLTTVPPPVPRRVTVPRQMAAEPARKRAFVPQAAESTVFEVKRTAEPAAPPPLPPTAAEAAKVFETAVGSSVASAPATPTTRTNICTLLGSREDLQRAIILREVFGPPRGLQPLDAIGLG